MVTPRHTHTRRHTHTPLLHSKRLVLGYSETHHLGLSIKAVQVYVGHYPEGARAVVRGHLAEVPIRELRERPRSEGSRPIRRWRVPERVLE